MRSFTGLTLGLTLIISGYAISVDQATAAGNMSHAHMGHVTKGWKDTPEGKGLLPTAIAEAKITIEHAGFAAKKPGDLKWMQMHTHHVLHAVDASLETKGPGLGYGVIKAAGGATKHINFAAKSDDASDNVRVHAVHVATTSQNTVARAKQIVALGQKVIGANSAAEASTLVLKIVMLSGQLLEGADANGDGKISWHQGEGGLNEATKHMGFMAKGEGMN